MLPPLLIPEETMYIILGWEESSENEATTVIGTGRRESFHEPQQNYLAKA